MDDDIKIMTSKDKFGNSINSGNKITLFDPENAEKEFDFGAFYKQKNQKYRQGYILLQNINPNVLQFRQNLFKININISHMKKIEWTENKNDIFMDIWMKGQNSFMGERYIFKLVNTRNKDECIELLQRLKQKQPQLIIKWSFIDQNDNNNNNNNQNINNKDMNNGNKDMNIGNNNNNYNIYKKQSYYQKEKKCSDVVSDKEKKYIDECIQRHIKNKKK